MDNAHKAEKDPNDERRQKDKEESYDMAYDTAIAGIFAAVLTALFALVQSANVNIPVLIFVLMWFLIALFLAALAAVVPLMLGIQSKISEILLQLSSVKIQRNKEKRKKYYKNICIVALAGIFLAITIPCVCYSGNEPKDKNPTYENFYQRYEVSERRLPKMDDGEAKAIQELNTYKPSEIQMIINEIYARNGYYFEDSSILKYFKKKLGKDYKPDKNLPMDETEKRFSRIEKYNFNILIKIKNSAM